MTTNDQHNPTCAERVQAELDSRLEDLRLLWAGYTNAECPKCDGTGEIEPDEPEPDMSGNWVKDVLDGKADEDAEDTEPELKPCEFCNGTGKLSEDITEVGNIYEYGLSFDYVVPHTFNDQPRGYFRYQLSWGGPSDEFRIYAEGREYHWNIDRIEYWFLDWFDGAERILSGEDYKFMSDLFDSLFVETGTAEAEYNRAMEDYEPPEDDEDEDTEDEEE